MISKQQASPSPASRGGLLNTANLRLRCACSSDSNSQVPDSARSHPKATFVRDLQRGLFGDIRRLLTFHLPRHFNINHSDSALAIDSPSRLPVASNPRRPLSPSPSCCLSARHRRSLLHASCSLVEPHVHYCPGGCLSGTACLRHSRRNNTFLPSPTLTSRSFETFCL